MATRLRENGKFVAYSSPLEHLMAFTEINPDTGCYEWTGTLDKDGYGRISINKRSMRAHRVGYNIRHGIELTPDQQLNHKCHNRRCWNPDHLYIGTQLENMRERNEIGRYHRGEEHPSSILTQETVLEIRATYATGEVSTRRLAAMLGVSKATIHDIVSGKTWGHLNE